MASASEMEHLGMGSVRSMKKQESNDFNRSVNGNGCSVSRLPTIFALPIGLISATISPPTSLVRRMAAMIRGFRSSWWVSPF
jgi:hypothetical protein